MADRSATDRKIRREVGKILWCLANGEGPRADVRMSAGQRSAVDHAAVDLIELYEKSADCVLVELYEGWQNAVNSDRSPEEFAYVLVAEAFDMVREAGFESLLRGGRPTFAIELHGADLTWDGELREPELDQRRNPTIPSQEDYLGETLGSPTLNPAPTNLACACGGTMVPSGTETIAGQRRYVAECPKCGDARYALHPYEARGRGRPPWLPNPSRLAPGVAEHERRARKAGSLDCPCGARMVDTGETRKLKGDSKRYIAECPNCGDQRYALAPYLKATP